MGNENDFQRYLLENENNPEADIILKKMLSDASSDDASLAEEGFRDFALRAGLARRQKVRRWSGVAVKIAAALFLPVAVLSFWALHKAADARTEWIQEGTTYAETRTVFLPDGSTVSLMPCSRLYYPERFTGKQRKVMLDGEAFLDVAKDARRKFIVSAGDMEVLVHGTRFNVSSFLGNEEDEVALLEGSVEMRVKGQQGSILLSPGELVKYDKNTGTAERRRFATNYYEEVLKAGGLQFSNEKLGDIAATLNRRFGVNIVVENKALASERYFASFINGEGVDEILAALNTGGHFNISKRDNIIYIKK